MTDSEKNNLIVFGNHLQNLRKSKNLSLRKLALNCKIEHSDIKKFENGERNMTFLTMLEYAKGLEITLKDLLDF